MFATTASDIANSKGKRDRIINTLLRMAAEEDGGNDNLTAQASSPTAPINALTAEAFEREFHRPDGFRRVAFAMHDVLKNRLDYQAIGRNNILVVDELTTGDVPFYDLDISEFRAVFAAGQGKPEQTKATSRRIQFPTGKLQIVHKVDYEDIAIKRFPIFDRAKERVAISVAIAEDDAIFGAGGVIPLASSVSANTPVNATSLSRPVVAELNKRILNQQLMPVTMLMHPVQYAEIQKFSSNELDQVTFNRVTETGGIGHFLGLRLLLSNRMERNKVFVTTTPDKLGRLPERKAVEVKVFDNVPTTEYFFLAWEQVGFGVYNTNGVAVANIPVTL